ncbi:hypothetical protein ACFE04_027567 [Oxalis oulophora]
MAEKGTRRGKFDDSGRGGEGSGRGGGMEGDRTVGEGSGGEIGRGRGRRRVGGEGNGGEIGIHDGNDDNADEGGGLQMAVILHCSTSKNSAYNNFICGDFHRIAKNLRRMIPPAPLECGELINRDDGDLVIEAYSISCLELFLVKKLRKGSRMDYGISDSSGTDDDLPPSHQNRFQRGGHPAGNGRSAVAASAPLPRMQTDMETQIHHIEQEAYVSVLRAFKAQSDAITWDKESLITELRKELRVTDEEHRVLLSRVNSDDVIRRIREWRKASGIQPGMLTIPQPVHEPVPSPTVSASRKKQKTSQSVASMSLGAPTPTLHPTVRPAPSALRPGPAPGAKTKKSKSSVCAPIQC